MVCSPSLMDRLVYNGNKNEIIIAVSRHKMNPILITFTNKMMKIVFLEITYKYVK